MRQVIARARRAHSKLTVGREYLFRARRRLLSRLRRLAMTMP